MNALTYTVSEKMLGLFKFKPTDKEVIEQILTPKIIGNDKEVECIVEIEFYKHEPWDLPEFSRITSDQEWFFFTQPERKYQSRNWMKRTTKAGFWKSTGKDQEIYSGESLIGMKKILVFHRACTSRGEGTRWVMHEYRTIQMEYDGTKPGQKAFVLCRLKKETEKKSKSVVHGSPALEVQAQTHITSNPSCDASAPVECNNDNNNDQNAYVAENQVDEQLEEDMIKFMQRPFVLCRLFKKQDESIEVSNHDDAELAVSSPTTTKSSPEDTQAELAPEPMSPLLGWKAENDPTSVECFIAEASDGSTSDTVAPINYNNSSSYGVENKVVELPFPEPDPELQRHLDMLYEPQFEPQFEPRDWTLLSPIHAQMQAELGSLGIYFPAHNDFNGGNNGVQFPHGSNEPDEISEFLESALCNPEECSYDEFHNQNNLAYDGQTSMKTEVVNELLQAEEIIDRKPHLQMETTPLQNPISSGGGAEQIYDSSLKGSNNHLSAFASGEVRNGFSITPRQRQKQPSNENSMTQMAQGTAPRRLRSHCKLKLQVRPLTTSLMSEDCSYTTEDHESKPVATEEEKASEKDAVASGHGAAAIALSERRKILSDSTENCKTPQEPNASMRPSFKLQRNKRNKVHACQNVFLFSKAPPVRHSNWPLTLLRAGPGVSPTRLSARATPLIGQPQTQKILAV